MPISPTAREAFDSAVDLIKQEPECYAHVRRNMGMEPMRSETLSMASDFTDGETAEADARIDHPPVH